MTGCRTNVQLRQGTDCQRHRADVTSEFEQLRPTIDELESPRTRIYYKTDRQTVIVQRPNYKNISRLKALRQPQKTDILGWHDSLVVSLLD